MYDGYIGEFENQEIVLYMFGVEHKMTAIEMFDVNGFKLIEENTTDEIEELKQVTSQSETYKSVYDNRDKINELVQAVNKINKEIIEKLK